MVKSISNFHLHCTCTSTCTCTLHISTHLTTFSTMFLSASIRAADKELRQERMKKARGLCIHALRLQHVEHALGEALVAQDDLELAARGDLLENLKLAQPHQRRV